MPSTFTCEYCRVDFKRPTSGRSGRYPYCSSEHYQLDRPNKPRKKRSDAGTGHPAYNRVTRRCPVCDTAVIVSAHKASKTQFSYCGRQHANEHMRTLGYTGGRPAFPIGSTKLTGKGYVLEKTTAGWIMQHRLVMAGKLGRPLRADEYVHHRNGSRDDNRPGNLELWSTMQPAGKRIPDLVAFAREILERYADEAA